MPTQRRIVICGPPNSGKTTYVREHASAGDLVFDWDAVAAAVTAGGVPPGEAQLPAHINDAVMTMRDALMWWVGGGGSDAPGVWFITANCKTGRWLTQRLKAEQQHCGAEPCRAT